MSRLRDEILAKYKSGGWLHAAMIELTHACPCDCEHCFLVREPRDEMTTDEVIDLLGQLRDLGVVNLGLTGGEPFTRPDLPRILEETKKHRFFTSVLTTAVTVGRAETDLMVGCGVKRVEVSLLGAVPETHDGIMRRPGAHAKTLAAVRMMLDAGLDIRLKATVMRKNAAELPAMHRLARDLGTTLEANVTVAPRVDGDTAPQQLALSEDEVARLDPNLIGGGLIPDEDFSGGGLLTCQAGNTIAAIGPRGDVTPCLMFPLVIGNIRQNSLQEILRDRPCEELQRLRRLTADDVPECRDCELRRWCQRCPGMAYMETGDSTKPSPAACALARGLARLPGRANENDRS